MSRPQLALVIALIASSAASATAAPDAKPTRVIVLGVLHNGAQLVAPGQQPAAFRAFIDRVKPDGICIERSPEEFARGDFYEFTFEQQDIVVPYARERRIPLHPIDWLPKEDDERLAFGAALSEPPLVRPARGYLSFGTQRAEQLTAKLMAGDTEAMRAFGRDFARQPAARTRDDFSRRLFLYRTFLQAMRIAHAARQYPGGTVLVVVGLMHKEDIEQILAGEPGVAIVQPSSLGEPTAGEIQRHVRALDLHMIASFNLLGLQARVAVDWAWLRGVVAQLARDTTPETQLFAIRLDQLTKKLAPADALRRYEALERATPASAKFRWTGVKDRSRLDSPFDPFGNLSVKQRVQLELARVAHQLGQSARVQQLEEQLRAQLTPDQVIQLRAYWKPYVLE